MTRRDWWLGVGAIVSAIVLQGLFPRYDWRDPGGDDVAMYIRIDRWTGSAAVGQFAHIEGRAPGAWASYDDLWRSLNGGLVVANYDTSVRQLIREAPAREERARKALDTLLKDIDDTIKK